MADLLHSTWQTFLVRETAKSSETRCPSTLRLEIRISLRYQIVTLASKRKGHVPLTFLQIESMRVPLKS